jgi:hypothetical protein
VFGVLVLIIAGILETPAKSPNGSVSFQVREQSVCHVKPLETHRTGRFQETANNTGHHVRRLNATPPELEIPQFRARWRSLAIDSKQGRTS